MVAKKEDHKIKDPLKVRSRNYLYSPPKELVIPIEIDLRERKEADDYIRHHYGADRVERSPQDMFD